MSDNRLPPGWEVTTLRKVADVVTGNTPSKQVATNYGDFIPLVKPGELNHRSITEAEDGLSRQGAAAARVLPSNSALVSCIGNLGKTGINRVPVAFNQQINAAIFPSIIVPEFGFFYFQTSTARDWMYKEASATTITILNKSKFEELPFPVAPLPEQRRIVAAIEEQFALLDAGVAALKRTRANLKRYRASVLKAAVEGRLTERWREEHPNTEDAKALLERILEERRARWEKDQLSRYAGKEQNPPSDWRAKYKEPTAISTANFPELPGRWAWSSLGECFDVRVGATPSRKRPEYWDGEVSWVSSGEVQFCRIKETKEHITQAGLANSSTQINPAGSVLLGMIGEGKTRGQVAIQEIEACNNQNCAAIRVSETSVAPEFVYYWLWSQYEVTRRGSSGNNQPALNKTRVEQMPVPLLPLAEQSEIVAEVERRLSVAEGVEAQVEAGLKRAARLRQAILKRAFEGRLVPQDSDDEPAEALLERIRIERAAANGKPKRKGRARASRPSRAGGGGQTGLF